MMNRIVSRGMGSLVPASAALLAACAQGPGAPADPGARDAAAPASAGGGPSLREALEEAGPDDRIPVLVTLSERVDVAAIRGADRHARRAAIVRELRATAKRTQAGILAMLAEGGAADVRPLWVVNGVAARVTPALARALRGAPGVLGVALDATVQAPGTTPGAVSSASWNVEAVRAPLVWAQGFDGAGVVVANMDTGVDLAHADLQSRWRGGAESWFDPHTSSASPYDAIGHGTQTMGIMVGGDASGAAIGVAPGARWIAAKIFDDAGNTTVSVIHQAFQWLLAPSGVPGASDAPDVVDASWGFSAPNGCVDTFQSDFEALRAAGIVVVFAAGNSGPSALTSVSPANNAGAFSVGAVDSAGLVASFSSRGPSACTGLTFPDAVAPGVGVMTADISFAGIPMFTYVSGTSFSAPHVAGAAALLAGAFPAATGAEIEQALRNTAKDLGPAGPDDGYGAGLVDAYAAYASLAGAAPPVITTSATGLNTGRTGKSYSQVLTASGGAPPYAWSVAGGALPPGLALDAATGVVSGTPAAKGTWSFSARVEDGNAMSGTKQLSIVVK